MAATFEDDSAATARNTKGDASEMNYCKFLIVDKNINRVKEFMIEEFKIPFRSHIWDNTVPILVSRERIYLIRDSIGLELTTFNS